LFQHRLELGGISVGREDEIAAGDIGPDVVEAQATASRRNSAIGSFRWPPTLIPLKSATNLAIPWT
jgi:hypothetical protein